MSLKRIISKLQRALCAKGIFIKINQIQIYSEFKNAMVTKYIVIRIEKEKGKNKNITLLETYKISDIAVLLSEMYRGDLE